ncbi:hypothetical protein F7725_028475 [Dissostichus mawsoni]|uniref:Uncharacterized protein n=1 Tax=Dissostichus mawsoni TaxID=36200 RepID=A0A7J5XH02_DISMA|nr:hypothetical protein F7725_028475 [Dissostichus mawsoni]
MKNLRFQLFKREYYLVTLPFYDKNTSDSSFLIVNTDDIIYERLLNFSTFDIVSPSGSRRCVGWVRTSVRPGNGPQTHELLHALHDPPTPGSLPGSGPQGQETTISSNSSTPFSSLGPREPPAMGGHMQSYRFGCPPPHNHTGGMQPPQQGANWRMNSPSRASPSPAGGPHPPQQNSMLSPRHRNSPGGSGSPRVAGIHSPSPVGMCGGPPGSSGNANSYTSSSLSALQALSECHGVGHGAPHTLGSPDRKMGSPVGVSQGGGSHLMSKLGGESYGSNMEETNMEPKEEREGAPDDSLNRLHDNKGHTKLLQLLTTKPEPLETPLSPGGEGKEGRGGQNAANTHASSLKEKHKILHQLLQNSTSPVDLAKLTAEATGKEPGQEQNQGAGGQGSGPDMGLKQEPLSPKKKDNALLRYLLDKDDTAGKEKMKLEAGEVKLEGGKHPTVKTEKQDAGYDRAEQSSELDDILNDLQSAGPPLFTDQRPVSQTSPMDKQNIINDILQMSDGGAALQQHRSIGMNPNFTGCVQFSRSGSACEECVSGYETTDGPRGSTSQHASAAEGWGGSSASAPPLGASGGPSGQDGPNGAPLRPNSQPGPRQMLQGPMMPNAQSDMDIGMVSHHFSQQQQQAPPNTTAPGPTA